MTYSVIFQNSRALAAKSGSAALRSRKASPNVKRDRASSPEMREAGATSRNRSPHLPLPAPEELSLQVLKSPDLVKVIMEQGLKSTEKNFMRWRQTSHEWSLDHQKLEFLITAAATNKIFRKEAESLKDQIVKRQAQRKMEKVAAINRDPYHPESYNNVNHGVE